MNMFAFNFIRIKLLEYFRVHCHQSLSCLGFEPDIHLQFLNLRNVLNKVFLVVGFNIVPWKRAVKVKVIFYALLTGQ